MTAEDALLAVGPPCGSSGPLEQLLTHAQSLPRRRLVFLGGYLSPGGDNETVVQMLRLAGGLSLAGAAEAQLVRRWRQASTPAEAQSWLDHYGLSGESFAWLASLPPAPGPVPVAWADRLGAGLHEGGPLPAVLLPEGKLWQSGLRRVPAPGSGFRRPEPALADDLLEDL